MSSATTLFDWLLLRGLTPQEADHWSDFVLDALELLDGGHALLRTASEWNSFLAGCATSPTEPDLTSGLGDRMRQLRNEAPLGSSRDRLTISYEAPTPGDHRHGKFKSKADFRFERKWDAGYAVAFVLEAKPLRRPADLTSGYLGANGLGCFTTRMPPYSTDLVVGMVGYSFNHHSSWLTRLHAALPAVPGFLAKADVALSSEATRTVSDHPRAAGLGVTVVHTFLEF